MVLRERVEEIYIYDLVKPNSTLKTRTEYSQCKFFLKNEKIVFKSKT